MYPMYKDAIQNAASELDSDRPTTSRVDDKGIIFPEDTSTKTDMSFGENNEYIRGYERYYKIWVKRFHIKNKIDGTEEVLLEEDMPEYLARPAIMVNGKVFTDPKKAKGIIEQMSQEYDKAGH